MKEKSEQQNTFEQAVEQFARILILQIEEKRSRKLKITPKYVKKSKK